MVPTQRRQRGLLLEGSSSLCFLPLHPALTHPGDLMLTLAGQSKKNWVPDAAFPNSLV